MTTYGKHYTNEKNVLILIALLKANGIRKVIASPGTTNMTFIGSIQNDSFFQIWSSVDERSAAYMACGMAIETGEPVVISCTGATASRNYLPGLTEAFYRKIPVLAVTSHRGESQIGHLHDQQIDRRVIPNDVAVEKVTLPMIDTPDDEKYCIMEANKAILALKLNGGGPVHINLYTRYSSDFTVEQLPKIPVIQRFTSVDQLPNLKVGKIGVIIGSHKNFDIEETDAIDAFCASNDGVVFCDHTSGYCGKYRVNSHLVCSQSEYSSPNFQLDLLIHIGEISATGNPIGKEVWRVSPDGALRNTFGHLTKVFMMQETEFFRHYTSCNQPPKTEQLDVCRHEYANFLAKIPELPFGNIWIAQHTAPNLPINSELHMGIFNSLRSWSFFDLPEGVLGKCNVGGFGIDGGMSSLIGASLARPDKLFFGVLGDLAFFYDMNVLGNRHVGNNVRILLINNSRGTEFRLKRHPCHIFGEDADLFLAAAGHFGNQSPDLVKGFSTALGFTYLSASCKKEYVDNLNKFISPSTQQRPILFEVFTQTDDESEALEIVQTLMVHSFQHRKKMAKEIIKSIVGQKRIGTIKKIIGK